MSKSRTVSPENRERLKRLGMTEEDIFAPQGKVAPTEMSNAFDWMDARCPEGTVKNPRNTGGWWHVFKDEYLEKAEVKFKNADRQRSDDPELDRLFFTDDVEYERANYMLSLAIEDFEKLKNKL